MIKMKYSLKGEFHMKCPRCNNELQQSNLFCTYCGLKLEGESFAPAGDEKAELQSDVNGELPSFSNEAKDLYVKTPVEDAAPIADSEISSATDVMEDSSKVLDTAFKSEEETVSPFTPPEISEPEKDEDSSRKKLIIILSSVIGVLVIAAVVFVMIYLNGSDDKGKGKPQEDVSSSDAVVDSSADEKEEFVFSNGRIYISGNRFYYYDYSQKESVLLSENEIDEDSLHAHFDKDFFISDDGRYIYYPENTHWKTNAEGVTKRVCDLCRKSSSADDETVTVISNVSEYRFMDDGNTIVYESNGAVYEYDCETETEEFVAYISEANCLDICSDTEYAFINSEMTAYAKKVGQSPREVMTDAAWLYADEDAFYILKDTSISLPYADYVNFDIELLEAPGEEPVEPDVEDYEDYEDYEKAYGEYLSLFQEYEDYYYSYHGESDLRELMEIVEAGSLDLSITDIYVYKNGKTKQVCSNGLYCPSPSGIGGTCVSYDYSPTEKIDFSSLNGESDISSFILDGARTTSYLLAKGNVYTIDTDKKITNITQSYDGKVLMCYVIAENDQLDVYRVTFNGKKLSSPKLECKNISYVMFNEFNDCICICDSQDSGSGDDVYINGIYKGSTDYNVDVNSEGQWLSVEIDEATNESLIYFHTKKSSILVDRGAFGAVFFDDEDNLIYTKIVGSRSELYIYKDGKTEKLCDKLNILTQYHTDQPLDKVMFTENDVLFIIEDGKAVKVADGVTNLVESPYDECGC